MRIPFYCCLFVVAVGCGVANEGPDAVQQSRSEIVGGVTDTQDPAVVALRVQGQEYCTGTLVGPKTVLTAAHCINVYGTQPKYYVAFGTYAAQSTQQVEVIAQYADPLYNKQSGTSHDFGVLRLATAVTNVAPIVMNAQPLGPSFVGMAIRHAGFGITSGGGGGGGTKRQVSYNVRQVTAALIESGAAGKQTCSGDSGGPAFMVMPGNTTETLVGVVSFGDQSCVQFGEDGRVDVGLGWISQTMAPWEGPSCAADGLCKAGCTPVDQDCACVADNLCNPDCADLLKDPDCPRDCVANGICATGSCPRPDPDCVAEGPNLKYCSQPCSAQTNPCVAPMECAPEGVCLLKQKPVREPGDVCTAADYCNLNGICTGPIAGGLTRCVQGCAVQSDCPTQTMCEGGADGQRFCRAPESVLRFSDIILTRATAEGVAAPTGCSSSGLGDLSLISVLLGGFSLIRRRRS
jgi:hypothetical protein